MSPYQRHIEELNTEDIIVKLPEYKYFFVKYFMPALDRILDLKYRGNCLHQAALTIIAVQRWQLDTGQYPDDLGLLVEAGYLRELPMDPYSDKPLVYKRTADGFTLYSVSENFTDDGGVWHVKSDGDIIQWGDTGDAIFWPLKN
jgi:hypothetical protein